MFAVLLHSIILLLCVLWSGATPQDWVNEHNIRRCQHMAPNVSWSTTLSNSATTWASNCVVKWSGSLTYGENLLKIYIESEPIDIVWQWYDEMRYYNFDQPGYVEAARDFTQLIWTTTTAIGCAIQACTEAGGVQFWFAVCHYTVRGNTDNFQSNVQPWVRSEDDCRGIPQSPSRKPSRSPSPRSPRSASPGASRSPVSATASPSPVSASPQNSPSPVSGSQSPTPSVPASQSESPSASPSVSMSPLSASPSFTAKVPSPSPVSATPSARASPSPAPSDSISISPLTTASTSAVPSPSPMPSPSNSPLPSQSPLPSPTPSASPSSSPIPSSSPSGSPSPSPPFCDPEGSAVAFEQYCICRKGWLGNRCNHRCPGDPICSGRGCCVLVNITVNGEEIEEAICNCTVDGAVGKACQGGCDIVNGKPCAGIGECVMGEDNFTHCKCPPHYIPNNCSDCLHGWHGPNCTDRCPGRPGPSGTWDQCCESLGAGTCPGAEDNFTCLCEDGWSGENCCIGQPGIPVPPSTMGNFWLHILNPTVIAGTNFTVKLAGYRTVYPEFLPHMQVKISQRYRSCTGTRSFVAEVDPATSEAILPAPKEPGVYSMCAKWRSRFELIVLVPFEGNPQDLVVTPPLTSAPLLGHQTCARYLQALDRKDLCGCFVEGVNFEAKLSNTFSIDTLSSSPSAPTVYTGCCQPLAPKIFQSNSSKKWGVCYGAPRSQFL